MSSDTVPIPRSDSAERTVLGSMLIENSLVHEVVPILNPSDFVDSRAQDTYRAICELVSKGTVADLITVRDALGERCDLSYLTELVGGGFKASRIAHYAKIVKNKSTLRHLAKTGERIMSLALHSDSPDEVVAVAEREIFSVGDGMGLTDFVSIGDTIKSTMDMLDEMTRGAGLTGISTGFHVLDDYTAGLQKGELYILAARPGMGKTALALNIAQNVARQGKTVGMFSMEMSVETLNFRLLCASASVDSMMVKTGKFTERDWNALIRALEEFPKLDIHINDKPGITMREVASVSRRLKRRHGLDLLIIDYMQLMSGGPKSGTRQQEISDISRALKGLSRELGIPVLALSQLSRASEAREDHRPQLSDLRESGAIEQDADVVIALYRDEMYVKTAENENLAEVIILKQRNGRVGSETMVYLKQFTRFENFNMYGGSIDQGGTTREVVNDSGSVRRERTTDVEEGYLPGMQKADEGSGRDAGDRGDV